VTSLANWRADGLRCRFVLVVVVVVVAAAVAVVVAAVFVFVRCLDSVAAATGGLAVVPFFRLRDGCGFAAVLVFGMWKLSVCCKNALFGAAVRDRCVWPPLPGVLPDTDPGCCG
jgi:hypothetical protein